MLNPDEAGACACTYLQGMRSQAAQAGIAAFCVGQRCNGGEQDISRTCSILLPTGVLFGTIVEE